MTARSLPWSGRIRTCLIRDNSGFVGVDKQGAMYRGVCALRAVLARAHVTAGTDGGGGVQGVPVAAAGVVEVLQTAVAHGNELALVVRRAR